MPVWVYSRTQKDFVGQHWSILQLVTRGIQNSPCAPEGGTDTTGDKPNPGTNVGASASPGEDCTDVGTEPNDPYTLGNAFPTYIGATWCDSPKEWRIQYYNYYV
ncbi:MAG: hypothetical protein Q9198_000912 [Flavoplaca austrocitrina]